MTKDPYEILGIGRDASLEEVKARYRELARKYHPDRYAGNELADLAQEKMKEINEAYDAVVREKEGRGNPAGYGNYGSYEGRPYRREPYERNPYEQPPDGSAGCSACDCCSAMICADCLCNSMRCC